VGVTRSMRSVLALAIVSDSDATTHLLPALREALSGAGPAVHPHPADRPSPAEVAAGTPFGEDEDDTADPTAAVVSTSGSTGSAKPALLSASALLASAGATHDRLGGPGTWLLGVPAHTVAGVMVCVRSLIARTTPVSCDLRAGFTPEVFLQAAARTHATRGARRYASLVPTQVSRVLAGGAAAVTALASFDAVLVGGAALPATTREAARAAGVRLVETYGASETCGGCVYDGTALDGVSVSVDPSGRIVISGAVVARGYRGRPGDPAFRSTPSGARSFVTDDLGRWQDGRLEVVGRADDMIVTGGYKVSPRTVEDVLRAQPGVADVVVVGLPDPRWGQRVAAAIVVAGGATATQQRRDQWRRTVVTQLGRWAAPEIHVVDLLPVTGPGKPDRRAVSALLAGTRTPPAVEDASNEGR